MSIVRKSKKALKFTFVDMPCGLLGITQLQIGNQYIRDLWASINSVTCPHCKRGVLVCKKDAPRSNETIEVGQQEKSVHYPWMCTNCDFALLEIANIRAVRESVRSIRNKEAIELLGEMEVSARKQRTRHYAVQSRVFFIVAMLAFGWFLYKLATGATLLYSAHLLSLGTASAVVGLKASYRSWQVETGTLFVEGAFLNWLKHERWFR